MKLRALAAAIGMVVILASPGAALSEPGSIEVAPADSKPDDPNGGRWFFARIVPSQTLAISAAVRNNSTGVQTVRMYLRDLDFSADGTPQIKQGPQTDVGGWGQADPSEVQIQPRSSVRVRIRVAVPAEAEPGDHIGAVVAETEGGRQVGVRIYVNVPGQADRAYEIEHKPQGLRWRALPSAEKIAVVLRNTGKTTLPLNVAIGGREADGPVALVSHHRELYTATASLPWYGGPVELAVKTVDRDSGAARLAAASIFVVPWGPIGLLVTGLLLPWFGIRKFRRRPSLLAALHAQTVDLDITTVEESLKRARRTGSIAVFEKLALALHESGEDALDLLLEALEHPDDMRRAELILAAASYGRVALLGNLGKAKLPPDVAAELIDAAQMHRVG